MVHHKQPSHSYKRVSPTATRTQAVIDTALQDQSHTYRLRSPHIIHSLEYLGSSKSVLGFPDAGEIRYRHTKRSYRANLRHCAYER